MLKPGVSKTLLPYICEKLKISSIKKKSKSMSSSAIRTISHYSIIIAADSKVTPTTLTPPSITFSSSLASFTQKIAIIIRNKNKKRKITGKEMTSNSKFC